ncbi:LamG domain-containing protein [Plantactinospora sp. CA-294935]|uniref:LamG domain-containing protein n=1 Tax=Plantactinospora sp. CA-294935 TaxID=3240012 RepID=UPI003D8B2304
MVPGPRCASEAFDEESAARVAVACAVRVEVTSARTHYTAVFAEPDGRLVFESAVVPQRTRLADGSWVPIDLNLVPGADGLWRPGASLADVAFSGGGTGPLVTLRRSGRIFSLSWPTRLPTPTVSEDSVTYPGVLGSDVDLVVRATRTGFAHVLVVRSAQAAASPALRTVRFGVGGDARVEKLPDGSVRASVGAEVVADAAPAAMWDSTGSGVAGLSGRSVGAELPSTASSAVAAGDGARSAAVAVTVDPGGDLLLTPDADLLTGAGTTYPVYVDPNWDVARNKWAYATNTGCTNTDHTVARVGLSPEGPCDGDLFRSFFEFPTTSRGVSLKGKYIHEARVQMELVHSYSCDATPVNLYASSLINKAPKASWSSTRLGTWLDRRSANAYKGSNCSGGSQPDATVNFIGGGVLERVRTAAAGNWSTIAVGFSARDSDGTDESSKYRWKKFSPTKAKLVVEYDSKPGKPNGLQIAGVACPAAGVGIGTLRPTFSAVYPDADSGQTLTGTYEWIEVPAAGMGAVTDTSPARRTAPPAAPATAGGRGVTAAVSGAVSGRAYAFRVRTRDPAPYQQSSVWSDWCRFWPDTTVPLAPTISSTAIPAPGKPITFTFSTTASDVVRFRYGWSSPPATEIAATGTGTRTAQVTLTLPRYGQNILWVRAIDAVGNLGNIGSAEIVAARPSPAVARWSLETYPGQTASQAVEDKQAALGGNTPLTPSNVSWSPDLRLVGGSTASFDGSTAHLATSGPVLDTTRSFSVAAWARLQATGKDQAIVAQLGATRSRFLLFYSDTYRAWRFIMYDADGTSTAGAGVNGSAPTIGQWTHLAGVYDATAKQVSLYVNGVLAGSAPHSAVWGATGPVNVGRTVTSGSATARFIGGIADVQVFDRALVGHDFAGQLADDPESGGFDEVGILAPIQVGGWDMEGARPCYQQDLENTCEVPDGTGFDRWVALSRGAEVGAGYGSGLGLQLDGHYFAEEFPDPLRPAVEWGRTAVKTGVDTSGPEPLTQWADRPVLRTDDSFTISAWAYVSDVSDNRTIVSQRGLHESAFWIKYAPNSGNWSFHVTDADNATAAQRTVSPIAGEVGVWTHLVGVYDAGRSQIRLYVNGELAGTTGLPWRPMASTGPLQLGRTLWHDTATDHWHGGIDQVHAYQGAMTDAQVKALHEQQSVVDPQA